jgi:hypothetical protein
VQRSEEHRVGYLKINKIDKAGERERPKPQNPQKPVMKKETLPMDTTEIQRIFRVILKKI